LASPHYPNLRRGLLFWNSLAVGRIVPVTLRCVPARTWMTPATVSARRPRGSPWVWRPLRSRERCGKSPHRVALATPLDDHVV